MSKPTVHLEKLREAKWQEYAIRFLFGGLITAAAGLVASKFGPSVGGLFLAFPAIFPAAVTLIEQHDCEKNPQEGGGEEKGRRDARSDSGGAALGALGLACFAFLVWRTAATLTPIACLVVSLFGWGAASGLFWLLLQITLVTRRGSRIRSAGR